MVILVVPICGYCLHYTTDEDFPTLFGICSFKPESYAAFRKSGCKLWEVRISLNLIKKVEEEFTRYRL